MTDHEQIHAQVVLAASGALSPGDSLEVQEHLRGCESCRREFESWAAYGRGLRQLPQPTVPLDLITRTQQQIIEARAIAKSQRWTAAMFVGLAVFSWLMTFSMWT